MIPKMDYIVCVKNDIYMLRECIEGILKQPNLNKIIVVLSTKSSDKSADMLEMFYRLGMVDIIVEESTSVTNAKRYGAQIAGTEYVVYVDADVALGQGWASRMWQYMSGNVFAITGVVCSDARMLKYQLRQKTVREITDRGMYADTIIHRGVVLDWDAPEELDGWGDYSLTLHILEKGGKWLSAPVFARHARRYRPAYFRGSVINAASARRAGYYKDACGFLKKTMRIFLGAVRISLSEGDAFLLQIGISRALGSVIGYVAWKDNLELRR